MIILEPLNMQSICLHRTGTLLTPSRTEIFIQQKYEVTTHKIITPNWCKLDAIKMLVLLRWLYSAH